MYVVLCLHSIAGVLIGFGEGVVGLEVFDGHKLFLSGVTLGGVWGVWDQKASDRRLERRLAQCVDCDGVESVVQRVSSRYKYDDAVAQRYVRVKPMNSW
jgi:hypothetical protein